MKNYFTLYIFVCSLALFTFTEKAQAQQLFLGGDNTGSSSSTIYNKPRTGDAVSPVHLRSTSKSDVFTRKTRSLRDTIGDVDEAELILQTQIANERNRNQQQAIVQAQNQRNAQKIDAFLGQMEMARQAELAANAQRFRAEQVGKIPVSFQSEDISADQLRLLDNAPVQPVRRGVFIQREKKDSTPKRLFNPY